jgi:uracil-DNA glycosylase family 4
MKRFSREGISDCKHCPLRDRKRVWGEYPSDFKPNLLLVGESPGKEENIEGKPFVGPAGRFLNSVLHEADIQRHHAWVTNLISCQPPLNDLDSEEGIRALACCKKGWEAETFAACKTVRLVMPLGTKPSRAFGIEDGITKARGSIYQKENLLILPTFHPSYLLRGMKKEESTWIGDFKKAKDILTNGYKAPKERFNLFPNVEQLEVFSRRASASKLPVAIDLETTSLRPEGGKIIVIGLALDGESAISVPFLSQGGKDYWHPGDLNAVRDILSKLFKQKECLFQNALFDVPYLQYNGFSFGKDPHDVMLMHHLIHAELPHNLGYIVSVYGMTPYWKGEVLGRESHLLSLPDEQLRTYNLRDAVVLHQVFPHLLADLKEFHLDHIYETITRPLIFPVAEMYLKGFKLDPEALKKWKRDLLSKRTRLQKKLFELAQLPESFSLSSDDHLRLLIFGDVAPQFEKAEEDWLLYASDSKKRKDTKKYQLLEAKINVARETKPLTMPKCTKRLTGTHKAEVNEEALLAVKTSYLNRLKNISGLKRKDATVERNELQRSVAVLDTLFAFNETDKLCTTYSSFPTWADGRVHGSYKIHGTKTGRLASSDPNMQNIPEDARVCFVSRAGYSLVGPDYSNLEVRILAYDSNDPILIADLEAGKNPHDVATVDLFAVEPSDSLWKSYRMAAKKWRFGRGYGGTLRTIYDKILLEVPDLQLTFKEFCNADARYFDVHPAYQQWVNKQKAILDNDPRITYNAFGRQRILLGDDREVEKELLNTPIQSTAADIVNTAMIGIYKEVKAKHLDACFVAQVHDALVMEVKDSDLVATRKIMKKHMEMAFHLWGRDVSFPVEMKQGKDWKNLKEVKR